MDNVTGIIQRTVPISLFNKGLAGRIFSEVKKHGTKVVMKNNAAECVLMSPDAYVKLMDELEDAKLSALAEERMARFDPAKCVTQEEIDKEFGFTPEMLADVDEVEIE